MSSHPTQDALTIWFTGLPASGKSSLAAAVADRLAQQGWPVEIIDADTLRETPLDTSLGAHPEDPASSVRRHALAAQLLARSGVVALVTAVHPCQTDHDPLRAGVEVQPLLQVHVSTPPEVCVSWDRSGLWRRALAGDLQGFVGVDVPYAPPLRPEVRIDLSTVPLAAGVTQILAALAAMVGLDAPLSSPPSASRDDLPERLGTRGYR